MRSEISQKAKRLTSWIALTAALTVGALAVAVVLFFELWWAGVIALVISMTSGVATVLLFMSYQADRRKHMSLTEQEQEDARIIAMVTHDGADKDAGKKADSADEDLPHSDGEDLTAENGQTSSCERSEHTTLEMRPPLRIISVEDAKAHNALRGEKEEQNSDRDKNEG